MKKQDQNPEELVVLDQTEQIQLDGGVTGGDGGCIPYPGPKLPDFPVEVLY